MTSQSTEELMKLLRSAKNTKDLKDFTSMLSDASFPTTFPDYLMTKMQCADMSAAELISRAQLQRNYGYQILDGRRNPSRDKVIAFSLALHLDVNETQRALMIAKNGQLYSKNKRDSILIFALEKKLSVIQTNELLYEMGEAILS